MRIGIKQATEQGYIECRIGGAVDLSNPSSTTRRGRVQGGGGISPTITTSCGVCKLMEKQIDDYLYKDFGVFKLTPRECGRLMGVNDQDIDKMFSVNSNSQCYKQFGNSIVVPVLMGIFSQLGIKGVRKWNDMNQDEREELIEKMTRKGNEHG